MDFKEPNGSILMEINKSCISNKVEEAIRRKKSRLQVVESFTEKGEVGMEGERKQGREREERRQRGFKPRRPWGQQGWSG